MFATVNGARLAQDYWLTPAPERRVAYREKCHPLYYTRPIRDPDKLSRHYPENPPCLTC